MWTDPKDLIIVLGDPAQFDCPLAFPGSNTTWNRDDVDVGAPGGGDSFRILANGSLFASRTRLGDAGGYQCVTSTANVTMKSRRALLQFACTSDVIGSAPEIEIHRLFS